MSDHMGAQRLVGSEHHDPDRLCDELREALANVGVKLPSLAVDPVTSQPYYRAPLIELGRCNVDTAARLLAVLRGVPERADER
ncbi:hypothetical protein ACL02R_23325 [Streptomyces sp. MS19]|uniref:hypothetical protein n=1 Tax=Streptomyces sp. MS19 TaxID=3385972 RepID=UPI00399FD512